MCGNNDASRKLAPLLPLAFRQGIEAATRNNAQNPYVPNSYLYYAWIAGWAMLDRGWSEGLPSCHYPEQPP